VVMRNKVKQKRRLKKAIQQRKNERIKRAWRSFFVKSGILNG
jgi:hypothetical protein